MRKFMTTLLALTMCLSLAGSAFAEGEAKAPAPEEQTETPAVEAETPVEDAEAEDATPGAEETPEEADQALGDQLARLMEEGELAVGEPYVLGVKYGHLHVDSVETMDLPDPEDIVVGEAYPLGVYYGHLCFDDSCPDMPDPVWDENAAAAQSEAGTCKICGKDNWGPPTDQDPYKFEEIAGVGIDYHAECSIRIYACNTANCDGVKKLNLAWIVPHT